jgi:hypothetical protein
MEIELNFKGYFDRPSRCGLSILRVAGRVWVIFTELPDNPGTSVTNRIEHLASEVYRRFLPNQAPEAIRWAECYPARDNVPGTLDEVTLAWNGKEFTNPKWRRMHHVSPIDR